MSNAIDLIVTKKAQEGLDKLLVTLKETHGVVIEMSKQNLNFNTGGSVKTISDLEKATEKYTKSVKQQEAAVQKQVNAESALRQRLAAQREREEKQNFQNLRKASVERKRVEKEMQKEIALLEKTSGLYNRVQSGISSLTKQYNDLAIRKELGGKLSAQEIVTLGQLEAKLNKYQSALKTVDANIGKHTRNVGNYKSGFDGLGFSIAQLTREAPAFANSMQTGFMAISNNIPMLTDEINKLKRANVELAASGKPTVSILKSIGSALFSWQTLISVGVTLLTVFGAKIIDWAFGMTEAEKATKKATEELIEQNKQIKENIRLRDQLIKGTSDLFNTVQYAERLREIFNSGIFESEKNEAFLRELSERLESIGSSEAKSLRDRNILQSDRVVIALNLLEIEKQRQQLSKERTKVDADSTEDLNKIIKIQERINQLEAANQSLINKGVEIDTDNDKVEKTKERAAANDLEAESIKSLRLEILKQIELYKALLPAYDRTTEQGRFIVDMIKSLEEALEDTGKSLQEQGKIGAEAVDKWSESFERGEAMMRKLKASTDNFLKGFSDDFVQNSPLSSLATFFDGTFELLLAGADTTAEKFAVSFNSIAESAQQAFSLINQLGQENFEQQYERLEQQKNIALQFAGESATARAEIERQADEKRRAIQKRQAEAQKEMALFNIGVDTAQAVVSALATIPPPGNIAYAALVGALGLAQLALVSSQQIPQFKDGVLGFGGGLAVVGDGGVNEVIETNKGVSLTPNKDTLVNLPKGSNVYKNQEEYFKSKLNSILLNNGINPINEINVPKGFDEDKLDRIMGKHISKLGGQSPVLNVDEKGFRTYMDNGQQRREILNARIRGLRRKK